jgi:anthranilate phosphoribosyltransferase
VHGRDGLDEVTTADKTVISEAALGKFRTYEIAPEDFGFQRVALEDLMGGSIAENLNIFHEVLIGKRGCHRDIVLLNSGCAIYAANKAKSIQEGIELARESIDSGKAAEKLELLKKYSQ